MGNLALKKDDFFTYKDYCSWDDGERWEIIGGRAYNMSPSPMTRHHVKELWFVHPIDKVVYVRYLEEVQESSQENIEYGKVQIFNEKDNLEVKIFNDLFIDLEEVFQEDYFME